MKFDTRNKKPKLYNLLLQALFVLLIVILLVQKNAQRHAALISALIGLFLLAAVGQLIAALFKQIQYNPYSYNIIYYMGFSLFLLAVAVMQLRITLLLVRYPQVYQANEILHILLDSAKNFMYTSSPFLLLFSIALCVSNISLIRHEGRRLVNILGILLSFLLVAGLVLLFLFDRYASGSRLQVMLHDLAANIFAAVYLYFECMLIGAIVADVIAARYEPEPDKDFLIILGCGFRKDGSPSPLLRGRLDRALRFAEKQEAATGKAPIFVTSGGQGPDEVCSESACMKRYLLEQGVPEERILEEDRSTDTFENMKYSKAQIWKVNPQGKVAFATTNYHVFRSGLYARRVKMRAVGMGADTKWYFWPNASVREFVGLLTEHRGKQILIFGSLILTYTILTILAYR
ncbi:MAG: YdcF family protein [Oscillospiraceae bacterium]|nr:YdcF family protein [Oscillospiraceae bacterium]